MVSKKRFHTHFFLAAACFVFLEVSSLHGEELLLQLDFDVGSVSFKKGSMIISTKPLDNPENWSLSFWLKDDRAREP